MTDVERRILTNQLEILWVLHLMLQKQSPNLVGGGGQVDNFLGDLVTATKETEKLLTS